MILRIILNLFFLIAINSQQQVITFHSAHTFNAFQVTITMPVRQVYNMFSLKMAETPGNWVQINTNGERALMTPPLNVKRILLNEKHNGRYIIQYYEMAQSTDLNRHFHYIQIQHNKQYMGYLLPSFTQKMPALKINQLYRCSNTLVSVAWSNQNAEISVFGQNQRWILHENIDNGFRSDERGLFYGYGVDQNHKDPIRIDIGDEHYCLINKMTPPANLIFNWKRRQNYELNDILTLIGDSISLHRKQTSEITFDDL